MPGLVHTDESDALSLLGGFCGVSWRAGIFRGSVFRTAAFARFLRACFVVVLSFPQDWRTGELEEVSGEKPQGILVPSSLLKMLFRRDVLLFLLHVSDSDSTFLDCSTA